MTFVVVVVVAVAVAVEQTMLEWNRAGGSDDDDDELYNWLDILLV